MPGRIPLSSRNSKSLRSLSYTLHTRYLEPASASLSKTLALLSPLLGVHNGQTISVRAGFSMPQHFDEFLLKCRRNGMLETLCFVVNFKPSHAENLGEHALDQVMAKNGSLRDLPSFGSQLNAAAS